ncbi:MAG: hypothetical protein AMXMBFR46_19850 [Acidimicrobiia bacterium]
MAQPEPSTLELRDYLRVLWRRKWTIIITVIVCVGAALTMSMTRSDVYSVGTKVLLERRLVDALFVPTEQQGQGVDSERRRANEIQIMASPTVREQVKDKLDRDPDPVEFVSLPGTDVINIVARGADPKEIAETANTYAQTYLEVRTQLTVDELNQAAAQLQTRVDEVNKQIADVDGSLIALPPAPQLTTPEGRPLTPTDPRITERNTLLEQRAAYADEIKKMQVGVSVAQQGGAKVLAEALPPSKPINQTPTRNLLAGLAIGLVLGIALAFLREHLDDTVKTKDDAETATGLTVVGIVPSIPEWKKRDATPLISMMQPRSPAAEAYRSVRTSIEFMSLDQPVGSVQVTSALAGEGKTSTLANLAVAFARAGQRVIVLCCDLRRPRVHEFFGLTNRVGFTSVLLGDSPVGAAVQSASKDLPIGLMASGPLPPNPAELLASKRAVDVVEELDRRCDLLLIDSPPVLPVTDALVISGLVDGVLLVANAGSSTKRGLKRATELLHQVEAPMIGTILTGVESKHEYSYVYGDNRYYLDTPAPEQPAKESASQKNGRQGTRSGVRAAR